MTPEERAAAFNAAALAEAKKLPRIQRETLQEIVRQLKIAERSVITALQSNPTESAQRRLMQLRNEIERALHAFQTAATQAATNGADAAWQAAINSLAAPLRDAGVTGITVGLSGARIDAAVLMAAKRFMTDRIKDISVRAVDRLNATLVQHLVGVQSLPDTITAVRRVLGGATRARAMTVTYTEIGRAYSVGHQAALERDAQIVPNLHKRWMHSPRLHPRASHIAANGQIVPHDKPFIVDGEKLMYPRDPNGSAANTINCGCHSIPVVDGSSFGDKGAVRIDDAGAVKIELPSGRLVDPRHAPQPKR